MPQIASLSSKIDPIATSFRIFRAGINETLSGDKYLFDSAAATAVMSAWKRAGIPLNFDLEHLSLDPKAPNYNPNSYGSCNLELRNGELWACSVRFTDEAKARIADGRQRYASPTFYHANGKPTEVFCCAIVAHPATLQAQTLWLAASAEMARRHPALSASERQACKDMGCSEAAFFALKSKRNAPVQRPVQRVAALSSNDAWFGKDSAQLFQIAKERGYVGGIDEIKAQIQADYNRDNQLAEAFGCTIGEIELTRSRLKLKKITLSPEEKAICKELGVLENVFAWNKSMKDARK